MSALSEFIDGECERYAGGDDDRFALSLGRAARYYELLQVIMSRSRLASERFMENSLAIRHIGSFTTGHRLNANNQHVITESARLQTLVHHLDVESFYLFSRVLLDELASFVEEYFGRDSMISVRSHEKLEKQFKQFGWSKGLEIHPEFGDSIKHLGERMVGYRDRQVAHFRNPQATKTPKGNVYSSGREVHIDPLDLPELMEAIDRYVDQLIDLVMRNRDKSRFNLAAASRWSGLGAQSPPGHSKGRTSTPRP